jgi:hypothetical protein
MSTGDAHIGEIRYFVKNPNGRGIVRWLVGRYYVYRPEPFEDHRLHWGVDCFIFVDHQFAPNPQDIVERLPEALLRENICVGAMRVTSYECKYGPYKRIGKVTEDDDIPDYSMNEFNEEVRARIDRLLLKRNISDAAYDSAEGIWRRGSVTAKIQQLNPNLVAAVFKKPEADSFEPPGEYGRVRIDEWGADDCAATIFKWLTDPWDPF